jgi:hypothetical protein
VVVAGPGMAVSLNLPSPVDLLCGDRLKRGGGGQEEETKSMCAGLQTARYDVPGEFSKSLQVEKVAPVSLGHLCMR